MAATTSSTFPHNPASDRLEVLSTGCAGALQGEAYRALAETRTHVLQPARGARDAMPAKGKKKEVMRLDARPAQLAGYSVLLEAGMPVVRADSCEADGARANPCTHCKHLDRSAIRIRATQAAILAEKVVCFEGLLSASQLPSHALTLVQREQAEFNRGAKSKGKHFLSLPRSEQIIKLTQVAITL